VTAAEIRRLFLHPSPTYSIPDAAALLGMQLDELRGWMEVGEIEGTAATAGW
jgi:hypothetical protein